MAASAGSDYELLTEHFSYPPVSLLDDIINTVNVLADRALSSVEELLLKIAPQKLGFKERAKGSSSSSSRNEKDGSETDNASAPLSAAAACKLEIESGTHQLETLLNSAIDKNFDIFELYTMQNILTVKPQDQPFVRLAHYEGLDLSSHGPGGSLKKPTLESITLLRRRLQASQKLNIALQAEQARNEVLLAKLRSALVESPQTLEPAETRAAGRGKNKDEQKDEKDGSHPLAFLSSSKTDAAMGGSSGTDKPITTTTEFALSQLQSLRALSASLRTLLPEAAAASDGDDTDQEQDGDKSWRRQRAEYIDHASRRYLERERGLELGPQGEVRDGQRQATAAAVGPPTLTEGEVEDLERVASLLGAAEKAGAAAAATVHQDQDTDQDGGGDESMT